MAAQTRSGGDTKHGRRNKLPRKLAYQAFPDKALKGTILGGNYWARTFATACDPIHPVGVLITIIYFNLQAGK